MRKFMPESIAACIREDHLSTCFMHKYLDLTEKNNLDSLVIECV